MNRETRAGLIEELESLSQAAGPMHFRMLADAMPIMIWSALPDGRLDFVNRYVLEFFGRSYERMLGEGWLGVLHPDDLPETIAVWMNSLQTGELYKAEFRVLHHSAEQYRWLDVRAQPLRNEQGQIVRWLGSAIDVHDVRYSRAVLESIEARYRLYAESTREGIWYWDIRTNRIEWSARALELAAILSEQCIGTMENFVDLIHPDDRAHVNAAIAAHLRRGEPFRSEFRMRSQGEVYRQLLAHGVAERDAAGEPFRMAGGLVDLTEQKEAEAMLTERHAIIERQAEAIRQLSTPIIEVWDGVLTMPVLGIIDAARAQQMTEVLLQAVVERQCRAAILDLTGVSATDEATVGYIGRMLSALSLLGARGIVVGIKPDVAESMVSLKLELTQVTVLRNLRQALLICMRGGTGIHATLD